MTVAFSVTDVAHSPTRTTGNVVAGFRALSVIPAQAGIQYPVYELRTSGCIDLPPRARDFKQRSPCHRAHTGFPLSRICANLKWSKHAFAVKHAFWAAPPGGSVQQPNYSLSRSGQARALARGTAAPASKPSHATGKAHAGGPGAVVNLDQCACPTFAKSNPQGEKRSA